MLKYQSPMSNSFKVIGFEIRTYEHTNDNREKYDELGT